MLTVNIKRGDFNEKIVEATKVIYRWNGPDTYRSVSIYSSDGTYEEYDCGHIFVMNENGKTIAKYIMIDDTKPSDSTERVDENH